MLVTLPLALLLLDLWLLGRLADVGPHSLWQRISEKLPLLLLSAASSAITLLAQRAAEAVASFERLPPIERLADSALSCAAPFLVLATVLAVQLRRKRPYVLGGWLCNLGTLVPVIGWIQVGGQAMADRYTWLPLVGIFVMAAWGVADLAAAVET